jgi:hypothetical protein
MTADVKGGFAAFSGCITRAHGLRVSIGKGGARQTRRGLRRLSGGGVPPDLGPSGAGLTLGASRLCQPLHAAAGDPTPGRRRFRGPSGHLAALTASAWGGRARAVVVGREDGHRLGQGPPAAGPRTGQGHGDHLGVWASGPAASVPLTAPPVGLPTAVLARVGGVFPAPWPGTTARGGRPVGPGACAQEASGLGVARRGHRPRSAVRPGGRGGGQQAPHVPPCPWTLNPCPVPPGRRPGDGHGPWPPTPGVEGLDHRGSTPRVHVSVPCRCATREACAGVMAGPAIGVQDAVRRRGGTPPRREPAPGGRAPMGPAGVTASGPAHTGGEAPLGVLASPAGRFTRPGARTPRGIGHGGAIHGRELPGAGPSGPWPRGPPGGVAPVAGVLGHPRGGSHPAIVPCGAAISGAPGATGAGVGDAAQRVSWRWPLTEAGIKRTWTGAQGAPGGALGAMRVRHIGHRDRIRVDRHAHAEGARWRQGCPPRVSVRVRHQAALAAGTRTRGTSGVNLPPSEVIMSRRSFAASNVGAISPLQSVIL